MFVLGSCTEVVETADLIADVDGRARVKDRGVPEWVQSACEDLCDGQEARADPGFWLG